MNREVIIACDFSSAAELYAFLDRFGEERPFVKIGMELFYAEGPAIVREIKRRGHKIFLDLKLHDIPNTVKRAMAILSGLNVDIINLHAAGTIEMMRAALEGLTRPDGSRPLLIAVTQLTSTSEQRMREELLIDHPINEVIVHYAENAKAAGLDGVVCSPLEAGMVKGGLRERLFDGHPRCAVCRRQRGGSGADHHPGTGAGTGIGLYCGRQADHCGKGSAGSVPALCRGIWRLRRGKAFKLL